MPDLKEFKEFKEFRKKLVDALGHELFGPRSDDSDEIQNQKIDVSPLQIFGTGILFPQKIRQSVLEESIQETSGEPGLVEMDDEMDDSVESSSGDGRENSAKSLDFTVEDQPFNLANEFSPSAVGITFRVRSSKKLKVDVSFGTYVQEKIREPNPKAGEKKADGTPYEEMREYSQYKRIPHKEVIDVPLDFTAKTKTTVSIPNTNEALKLNVSLRSIDREELVLSLMLVNHSISSTATPSLDLTFFQVEFRVCDSEGGKVFAQIDRPTGASSEDDIASMELLYRHRKSFCLGHGCSGDWRRGKDVENDSVTDWVGTATIPQYEIQPIQPRENPYGSGNLNLSMKLLSEGTGQTDLEKHTSILSLLEDLCKDYEVWIEDMEEEARSLPERLGETAARHIAACHICLNRMREGISFLASVEDKVPLLAFRLANRAMLMQQVRSEIQARDLGSDFPQVPQDYDEGNLNVRSWRPFQLAFILMNVAGALNHQHVDRPTVDIIWFPTGGGKTEAYLGLAAFVICLRRLRGANNAGTTVLMRYTLRLLSAQQFQRASLLILSLETLRLEKYFNSDLGQEPISIGLWVGQSLSPNWRKGACADLKQMRQGNSYVTNPFQVLYCPWCQCKMTNRDNWGYVNERTGTGRAGTVRFRCPDALCPWSRAGTHMPIMVIDEDIYDSPPTLILGTVDKFAQVAWNDQTGRLFGIGLQNDPPDLIIQDELHLISGPLGTMVGLYEAAIERFCTRDQKAPKIIASTATIRQAREQCQALYNRKTFEFPPQGLKAGDSYFAFENRNATGRLYVGVFASGLKSNATAQVRTCSSLLQSAVPMSQNGQEQLISSNDQMDDLRRESSPGDQSALGVNNTFPVSDPYGTLVWYFNSLRELGHAATLCTGDIPEYLKSLCRRGNVPLDLRRRIRNYVELNSRRTADEIPDILEQLERTWTPKPVGGRLPVDVLLASNMISVGIDVSRLGLMVVTGQPKNTSEYIQATSRVGRKYPGLVVTIYNTGKSRDRSHYEQFISYHQSFYRFVEATSITPFSPPARQRGLRGVLIALARLSAGITQPSELTHKRGLLEEEIRVLIDRIRQVDPGEVLDAEAELNEALNHWEAVQPAEYGKMAGNINTTTLAYPFGSHPDPVFQQESWPILTSMRNVDGTAVARVITSYNAPTEGED